MGIGLEVYQESEDIRTPSCLKARQDAWRMIFIQQTTQYQDAGNTALKLCFAGAN